MPVKISKYGCNIDEGYHQKNGRYHPNFSLQKSLCKLLHFGGFLVQQRGYPRRWSPNRNVHLIFSSWDSYLMFGWEGSFPEVFEAWPPHTPTWHLDPSLMPVKISKYGFNIDEGCHQRNGRYHPNFSLQKSLCKLLHFGGFLVRQRGYPRRWSPNRNVHLIFSSWDSYFIFGWEGSCSFPEVFEAWPPHTPTWHLDPSLIPVKISKYGCNTGEGYLQKKPRYHPNFSLQKSLCKLLHFGGFLVQQRGYPRRWSPNRNVHLIFSSWDSYLMFGWEGSCPKFLESLATPHTNMAPRP